MVRQESVLREARRDVLREAQKCPTGGTREYPTGGTPAHAIYAPAAEKEGTSPNEANLNVRRERVEGLETEAKPNPDGKPMTRRKQQASRKHRMYAPYISVEQQAAGKDAANRESQWGR